VVFQQYAAESKFLNTAHLDLDQTAQSEQRSSSVPNLELITGHQKHSKDLSDSGDNLLTTNKQHHQETSQITKSDVEIMLDMPPKNFERQPHLTHVTHLIDL